MVGVMWVVSVSIGAIGVDGYVDVPVIDIINTSHAPPPPPHILLLERTLRLRLLSSREPEGGTMSYRKDQQEELKGAHRDARCATATSRPGRGSRS